MKPVSNLVLDMALAKKRIDSVQSDEMTLSGQLKVVLKEARSQGRLTRGIYECGKLLELNPEGVMLCLLPENSSSDVALHIHITLIEAFCWENFIRVIKVDSLPKAMSSMDDSFESDGVRPFFDEDLSCILIEYPEGEVYSEAEESLLDYYKFTSEIVPQPFIPLE